MLEHFGDHRGPPLSFQLGTDQCTLVRKIPGPRKGPERVEKTILRVGIIPEIVCSHSREKENLVLHGLSGEFLRRALRLDLALH